MAEREGFEPSVTYATAIFKTAALNHSTISPFFMSHRDLTRSSVTDFAKPAGSSRGLPSVMRA